MLKIGELVDGKYRVLREIGHGGMSVVYMAINEKANKTWAIKEVRKDGTKNFDIIKQGLVVETEMLKKLKHHSLPSIIDVIDSDDTLLIVMDYIEGNPLSSTLEEYGAQPQELVIEWAKQMCDVLGYLHTRNPAIIYRDMKPANVMLKPDGNITLIDFGTAREFKERNIADTTCLGTIGYAAPEQFGGSGQTDPRTDIYCLGATLYHLVTGCNPSEPPYEMRPIREINPSLSSGLEKILLKCTQRNPEDRYQSCAELMYALEHYEEIDDLNRKRKKRKIVTTLAMFLCSLASLAVGLFASYTASNMAEETYAMKLDEADKTSSYDEKTELYIEAILTPNMAGKKDAYIGLINNFKMNDYIYSTKEEEILIKYLKMNKNLLELNVSDYAELCFETGKLYWYYYAYGNSTDNQMIRMKASETWFSDAVSYGGDTFQHMNMAVIYRDIGKFYREIAINTVEASDKGMYITLWDNLNELYQLIEENEEESEIVKLELFELIRSSMNQYATKYKGDGVSQEEMLQLLETVSLKTELLDTTTEVTENMKEKTMSLFEETEAAIHRAFSQ